MSDEQEDQGDNKRASIANQTIEPPPLLKGIGAGAEEEDEEDVDGHGEGPPRIALHEPTSTSVLRGPRLGRKGSTHISNMKLCA